VSVTQLVSVFVDLSIQNAMRMRHIVIYGLPRSTLFFHLLINGTISGGRFIEHYVCVSSFSKTCD